MLSAENFTQNATKHYQWKGVQTQPALGLLNLHMPQTLPTPHPFPSPAAHITSTWHSTPHLIRVYIVCRNFYKT